MRILAVFLLGLSSRAAADDVRRVHCPALEEMGADLPPNQASAHEAFLRAREYYSRGEYLKAARTFHESYQRAPDIARPDLVWNAAVAFDKAGENKRALALYRCHLPHVTKPTERRELEARIAVLEDLERQKTATRTEVAPRIRDVTSAEETQLQSRRRIKLWPWLIGGSAALGAGGLVVGLLAQNREDDLAETCGVTPKGCSDGDISGVRRWALAANMLYATAGTTAIAGALFYFRERDRPRATLVPLGMGAAIVGYW